MSTESLRIVWIYPDLLSTYGDRGNLLILARRAAPARHAGRGAGGPLRPAAARHGDIYLIGGGEDGPQALGAQRLLADGGLHRAVAQGAVGLRRLRRLPAARHLVLRQGRQCAGLELLDLALRPGATRAVGELAGEIDPRLGLPPLTGFENHGGRTHLGPGVSPLARVTAGVGNDGATEGAWRGRLLGTYSHGPALARNPALADLLLRWATGAHQLPPLDDTWPDRLRAERRAAVAAARRD